MKKNLLVLATLLAGNCAMAQDLTATWERPVPTEFAEWQPETSFYMYNVDGGGFYIAYQGGGPDEPPHWRTRSSVNDTIGAEVKFTRTNPDATFEEIWDGVQDNAYLLVSYVPKFNEFRCTFSEGRYNSVWTDNNTGFDHGWNVILNSDGSFCIEGNNEMRLSDYDYTGKYMGILASDADRVLYLKDVEQLGADAVFYDKWKVMTPEQYENYMATNKAELLRVEAAISLRKAIEAAQEANPEIDYSRQIAVYNNTASTIEELKSAEESLQGSLIDVLVQGASVDNPADLTQLINNPSFDGMQYTGWKGDLFGAGGDVDEVAEHFNKNFDTYQTITGLPTGIYEVRVNGFYRAGASPNQDYTALKSGQASNARLYIKGWTMGEFSTPVKHLTEAGLPESMGLAPGGMQPEFELITDDGSLWLPNTMVGANAYFHNESTPDLYKSIIAGAISEGDTLQFGVKKSVTIRDDWALFDDFQLLYYGNSEEAYRIIVDNALATNAVDLTSEGIYYGAPEYEAYNEVCNALKASATQENILENLPKLAVVRDSLAESVAAYTKYVATIKDIEAWLGEVGNEIMGEDVDKLSDYIFADADNSADPNGNLRYIIPDYDNGTGEGILSASQILAEIEYVNGLKANAIRNSLVDGSDLTDLIRNSDFNEAGPAGWIADSQYVNNVGTAGTITNWHGGTAPNYTAEAFNHNFDVYQEIEGLTNGLYEVSVHAFYRTAHNSEAFNAWKYQTGDEKVLSEVYLNEFSTPVKNVMEIQFAENLANNCWMNDDGFYTLDGMASASVAFALEDDSQNFKQRVYGLVTDGKLRLGIRNTTGRFEGRWTLFDKFKLTFRGKNAEALASVIDNYAERADYLSNEVYGLPESLALTTAVDNAQSASTGDDKYDALIDLVEAYNTAVACVDAYTQLNNTLDLFNEALLEAAVNNPGSTVYGDAADYYDELANAYGNQELTAAQALSAIDNINEWISKLRIPDYAGASDDTPVDMTNSIVNPSFDIVNEFTGWDGTQFGTGGDAGQNAEHYEKNFDSYQYIYGLPAGTYELSVKGMYRHGHYADDFQYLKDAQAAQAENPDYVDPTLLAFLYAQTPSTEVSATIDHTTDGGKAAPDFSNTNAGTTEDPCYVADSRTSADLFFHDETAPEAYLSKVVFNLKEGEPLRIGVKKDGEVLEFAWAIFDDFRLVYFGTESTKTESGNPVAVESVTASKNVTVIGVYTINGTKVNAVQKGINIIRLSDGSVRKVYVK